MKAKLVQDHEPLQRMGEEVVNPEDFAYFVMLLNGEVLNVAPATSLRLTNSEVVFLLGELVVARLPRQEIYFAGRELEMPPVPS